MSNHHLQGATSPFQRHPSAKRLRRLALTSLTDIDWDSLKRSMRFLNFRKQSQGTTRPSSFQRLPSMSRSLMDMSDFAHQELTQQEPMTEMSLLIPMKRSMKRTSAEWLSDTRPSLLSQMTPSPWDPKSTSVTSLGSHAMTLTHRSSHRRSLPRSLFSRIFHKASKRQRHLSSTPWCSHSSLSLSGSASFQGEPSISTTSLPSTTLPHMKKSAPSVSVRSSLSLVAQGPPKWLKHMATGFLCGIRPLKQRSLSLSTEPPNSETTAITSLSSSPHSNHHCIPGSSSTTVWCETMLPNIATSCSPTLPSSLTSTSFISRSWIFPQEAIQKDTVGTLVQVRGAETCVGGSMRVGAPTCRPLAHMPMYAPSAKAMHTPPQTARWRVEDQKWENWPRYARDFVWVNDAPPHMTLAAYTEIMPALPSPPENKLNNEVANATICNHPHLFQLITPINIDCLEQYLSSHPNQALAHSITLGFCQGFWPYTIMENAPRLPIVDNSSRVIKDPVHAQFIHEQRDYEIWLGCFSLSFGPDLLPGMTAIPIGVVPKPHSNKLRLVVDQSSGDHSPNGFIPRQDVAVPLNNLHDLSAILHNVHTLHGMNIRLVLFKSDISQAYRRLPLCFLWQLFQIITIDRVCHVNRNNNFRNRGAGGLWGAFMGVVLWIAIHIKQILDLLAYVDNTFSWEFADNLLWYQPYACSFPAKQTHLLELWDELSIPHEQTKQLFGSPLTIVGLDVDANAMTITMPQQLCADLIAALRGFACVGQQRSLREFQKLAGWMSWALNTYPLLCPGMLMLYHKQSGKSICHQLIWVSKSLCQELIWFVNHIEFSSGVHVMSSNGWGKNDADFNIFCDACLLGLGFWYPAGNVGFMHPIDTTTPTPGIFYHEALTVVSTIYWSVHNLPIHPGSRLAAYTDNANTVDMFNSLRGQPLYNPLLITVVELLLKFDIALRVFHIPGEDNFVADALSHLWYDIVWYHILTMHVSFFIPPQLTLGVDVLWQGYIQAPGSHNELLGAMSASNMLEHLRLVVLLMPCLLLHTAQHSTLIFPSAGLTTSLSIQPLILSASTLFIWHTISSPHLLIPTSWASATSLNHFILMSERTVATILSPECFEAARSFVPFLPPTNALSLVLS